jgi:hypothetical protein
VTTPSNVDPAVVDESVRAIKQFAGVDCDRAKALAAIHFWKRYTALNMGERNAVLAKFPEREPFGEDFFLEDLGEKPDLPPLAHRIIRSGRDGMGGYYARCSCEWMRNGFSTADALAYAVEAHIVRNTAGVMHKAVS